MHTSPWKCSLQRLQQIIVMSGRCDIFRTISGAAKIGMMDLDPFGTVLNQYIFNTASSKI